MAELNLKQIIDRLNAEFTGETRKLVFWYDDKAEFVSGSILPYHCPFSCDWSLSLTRELSNSFIFFR